jgi:prepilin-type N-terminal cleavage/methylation domain-containing protein
VPNRAARPQAGFTLTELLIVITIIAILAAVAVPALTRDDIEARYKKLVNLFLRDIQRAHMEAIASRTDRRIVVNGTSWTLEAIDRSGTTTFLAQRQVPVDTWIASVAKVSHTPWASPAPSAPTNAAWGSSAELRFHGIGTFEVAIPPTTGGTLSATPATVYFGSGGKRYTSRVVLFPATSYAKLYEGW